MSEKQRSGAVLVFNNTPDGDPEWNVGVALAEDDGTYLAGHCSSSEAWLKLDMGVARGGLGERKRERYAEHYPDGFEVVFLDARDPRVTAAYEKNQAQRAAHEAAQAEATT